MASTYGASSRRGRATCSRGALMGHTLPRAARAFKIVRGDALRPGRFFQSPPPPRAHPRRAARRGHVMDSGLKDAALLVTGASTGIGRPTPIPFRAEGARVALTYRTKAA